MEKESSKKPVRIALVEDVAPVAEEPKVNIHTFVSTLGNPLGIKSRMQAHMGATGDSRSERTLDEWKKVYSDCMNRVTN